MARAKFVKTGIMKDHEYFEIHVSKDCVDPFPLRFGRRKAFALLNALQELGAEAFTKRLETYVGTYRPQDAK